MPSPRPLPLRRRDLLVGGVAGLAVTAAAAESAWSLREASGDETFPGPVRTGPIHMQIVAHPDDCLYFINPRIARVLEDGAGICTVVLTAGEADGRNTWDAAAPPDFAGYAAARDNGMRRAYAQMALGDADAPWDRYLASLDSGQEVELCVLRDQPAVHLVFCSLWTNLGRLTGEFTRLLALWEGSLDASLILPPTDSPLSAESTVDRATIQATLLELLDRYRPAVVNTLDPDPDPVVGEKLGAEQTGYSDHIDHTAAALFAWEAVRAWGGARSVEAWRGYYNRRWPGNLGEADLEVKGRPMDVYSWTDGADCDNASGCGDRLIVGPGAGITYGHATHPRYPAAVTAAAIDGVIRPITVRGSRAHVLGENGWEDLGGPDMLPSLARSGKDVFAISAAHTHDPAAHTRDVQYLDLATGRWQLLGNPAGRGEAARTIGQVTSIDDGNIAVFVCVRDPEGGLSVRARLGQDEWADWTRLEGPAVHDAPVGVTTPDLYALLAATPDNVAAWENDGTDWTSRMLDLPGPDGLPYVPASAVNAVGTLDGRIVLASRAAGGGDVALHFGRGETWTGVLVPLEGGVLAPALALGPDGALAVVCDDGSGAPAVLLLNLADLEGGDGFALLSRPWTRGDITVVKRPAAAFGSDGALRMWAVAADGELWTAEAEPGAEPPAGWSPAA